ncbi:hypothetical protein Tco_1346824 [Tanacetum coccineum]
MDICSKDEILKVLDRVLWGDLMVMFNLDDEIEFWNYREEVSFEKGSIDAIAKIEGRSLEVDRTLGHLRLIRFTREPCRCLELKNKIDRIEKGLFLSVG